MKKCYTKDSCFQCKMNKGCQEYQDYKSIRQGAAQSGVSQSEYVEGKKK